jgi:hypothetical protein
MTEFDQLDLEALAHVTGGGNVDYSLQSGWIDKRLDSMSRNGMLAVERGSRGNATRNPNLTPNIIPIR